MTASRIRVAVVDDDPEAREIIEACLSDDGYVVDEASNGGELKDLLRRREPAAVLMDLNLSGDCGLDLTRELRNAYPWMGIIIVSGKMDVVDRVAGLEVGADDYVPKPFHVRELQARVRSVLRRCGPHAAQAVAVGETCLRPVHRFAGWTLDCESRALVSPDEEEVQLTSGMFELLQAFAARPNRVLSREQLKTLIGRGASVAFDRSIDVQVGRLRRCIERDPKRPAILKTVRNAGYMLSTDISTAFA